MEAATRLTIRAAELNLKRAPTLVDLARAQAEKSDPRRREGDESHALGGDGHLRPKEASSEAEGTVSRLASLLRELDPHDPWQQRGPTPVPLAEAMEARKPERARLVQATKQGGCERDDVSLDSSSMHSLNSRQSLNNW